jgi:dihydroorotase
MIGHGTSLTLRGVRLLDPAAKRDEVVDLVVVDGVIAACKAGAARDFPAVQVRDGEGTVVMPGLSDLRSEFGSPGREYRETWTTGLQAAAAGGYVQVCALPHGSPLNDDPLVTAGQRAAASAHGGTALLPLAAITRALEGKELAPLGLLTDAGAAGFTDGNRWIESPLLMYRAMEYAAAFDQLVLSAPREPSLTGHGVAHESAAALAAGMPTVPVVAETVALQRDLFLAAKTGVRFHASTLSTQEGLNLLRIAKEQSTRISASVSLHHLLFDETALAGFDSRYLFKPPLRAPKDREALWSALRDGTLDCIVTDHCPRSSLETEGELDQVHPGAVGLQVALSALWSFADVHISALRLVDALSTAPARILGQPSPRLAVGQRASLVWFDPRATWTPSRTRWYSRSKNSPLFQTELRGRVLQTVLDGRTIYPFEETP